MSLDKQMSSRNRAIADMLKDGDRRVQIKMLLLTGMRSGELSGLRWSDIDYEKRVVHIRRNRQHFKETGYFEKEPKTKTSIRDIPLPTSLIAELKEYEDWFREACDDFDQNRDKYYVSVNVCRQPLYVQMVGVWLRELLKKWQMKNVSRHGLRHTYCSLLLSQNVPIQTVSKYMGHSDSTVTLKVYSHFIPDTQDKALEALDRISYI